MAELLITSSLDPIERGQVFNEGLPRHVTIWQSFKLPDFHLDEFTRTIGSTVQAFKPMPIMGIDDVDNELDFGPKNDAPARHVLAMGSKAALLTMHKALGEVIARYEGEVDNPEWTNENYKPYVSFVDGSALKIAEFTQLRTVELIEKIPGTEQAAVKELWELEES